jgi:hypothetical protein
MLVERVALQSPDGALDQRLIAFFFLLTSASPSGAPFRAAAVVRKLARTERVPIPRAL